MSVLRIEPRKYNSLLISRSHLGGHRFSSVSTLIDLWLALRIIFRTQIRQSLRKRVFEEAGIAVKQVPVAIKVDNNGHAEPVLKSEPGMMVMMSSGCDDILNVDAQEVVGDDDDQLHDHKLTIMDHEKSSESELMCTLNEFNATADDLAIITTEEEEEEESTSPDCLSREQIKGIIE